MLDRICVGVDGSDCARRAATVAVAIAEAVDATVDVVRVLSADETADGNWNGDRVLDESQTSGRDRSADDATTDRSSVAVEGHALVGSPAATLVEFADDTDADLLVLGRRGLGGVRDRLLGSVVHDVLRTAGRPVLTVPSADEPFELSELLVPTDGNEAAERSAPIAAALAGAHGATVHACYVLDLATAAGAFSAGGVTAEEIERFEAEGYTYLDRLADRLVDIDSGLTIERTVVRDAPHDGIATAIDDHAIDLVVMSSTGSTSAVGQVLGSVGGRVLRTVDVPVLVVPGGTSD